MSDTPSPTPAPEAPKPRLSLTPKAPVAAPAPSPAPEPAIEPTAPPAAPALQASSSATPAGLLATAKPGVTRPSLKLSGTPHPSVANPTDAKLDPPVAASDNDAPPMAVVALSGIAAAAALTFAALLFLKNQ